MCGSCQVLFESNAEPPMSKRPGLKNFVNTTIFQDLAWFNTFLQSYNGVTFYDQTNSNIEVHLDACLTGLGGHFGNLIYTLPIPLGFRQYGIT